MEIDNLKKEFDESLDNFKEELQGLRVGRASTQLVEGLEVDYYGAKSPLKQMAQVSVPDAKTIQITPWNKDDLVSIEKAISESDLNLAPNNDGNAIFLNLPPMTEDRRLELVKILNKKAEETRVSVRQKREKTVDELNEGKKEGIISEDEFFSKKEDIQKIVDEYMEKIEAIREKKEEEIKKV